ncbi:unnamed protein product [Moneuplotes crassus]|uniref:Uncharacterized protein n=1 Tax=Euplotes crassus TaxID=5936 RepID=A0AAD2CY25_EUPCR|nr:unnamed protein product [Moneuplotes crassus]
MGKSASKEEKTWFKVQKEKTKLMYSKCSKIESALIGNNEAGKTTFIRRLTNDEYDPDYEETIITQMGVKLIDFKDKLDFPMYLRLIDTPGNAVSFLKDEQSVFENLDIAFVVLDGSKVIHKEHVISVNNYVIQRLRTYNKKVIEKEKKSSEYKNYLCKLLDEESTGSGNLIPPDEMYGSVQDDLLMPPRARLDIDDRSEDPDNSFNNDHSEVNHGMSQHTIVNLRQDTYKSRDEENKQDADDIVNLYRNKKIKIAMFPAVFHIITKKDMLSDEGLEDQRDRAAALKAEGIIDEYFFISSKDVDEVNGIFELLEGINDRRMEVMRQERDEKDSQISSKGK